MASRLWLCVVSGDRRGGLVEVTADPVTIGSGQANALRLLSPGVAPLHATIARQDGGAVVRSLVRDGSVTVDGAVVDGALVVSPPADVRIAGTRLLISPEIPDFGALQARHTRLDEAMAAAEAPHRRRRPRRRAVAAAALLAAAVVVAVALVAHTGDEAPSGDIARVVRLGAPGTVLVGAGAAGEGSGWVADARRGLVVTNFHVVNGGRSFEVVASGRAYGATLYAAAPCDDIAVLRVAGLRGARALALALGDDERPAAGAIVVALGFPANAIGAAKLTSTAGVVSVTGARLPAANAESPSLPDVVQTDAHLNPGASGGPLLDLRGRVVGMDTAVLTSVGGAPIQGQGYAIAAARLKRVLGVLDTGRSLGWPGRAMSFAGGRAVVGGARVSTIAGRALGPTLASYCDAVRGVHGPVPVALRDARTGATRSRRMGF
jgi:S1-C subfamily serine protease